MNVPMDYHLLFLVMNFVLLFVSILLLFLDTTMEKATAAMIFIMINMILTIIVALIFGAVDVYGYDSDGNIVHNIISDLYPFIYVYWTIFYINLMLLVYGIYVFIKKPWDEYVENENQTYYENEGRGW